MGSAPAVVGVEPVAVSCIYSPVVLPTPTLSLGILIGFCRTSFAFLLRHSAGGQASCFEVYLTATLPSARQRLRGGDNRMTALRWSVRRCETTES